LPHAPAAPLAEHWDGPPGCFDKAFLPALLRLRVQRFRRDVFQAVGPAFLLGQPFRLAAMQILVLFVSPGRGSFPTCLRAPPFRQITPRSAAARSASTSPPSGSNSRNFGSPASALVSRAGPYSTSIANRKRSRRSRQDDNVKKGTMEVDGERAPRRRGDILGRHVKPSQDVRSVLGSGVQVGVDRITAMKATTGAATIARDTRVRVMSTPVRDRRDRDR
jgi:hypothetical protein